MASTITLTGDWLISIGNRKMTHGTGNLGTYVANGIAVTAQQLGLGQIDEFTIDSAGGYIFRWDKTAGKVMAYQSDDAVDPLDEVGSVDITTTTFRWQAIGY